MTFEEINEFLISEQARLDQAFPIFDKEKAVFARLVKLTEEYGELSEAVLSYFSLQRKDKDKSNKEDVANEIADVLIGVMLLANQLGINIEESLENKIEIIKKRNY